MLETRAILQPNSYPGVYFKKSRLRGPCWTRASCGSWAAAYPSLAKAERPVVLGRVSSCSARVTRNAPDPETATSARHRAKGLVGAHRKAQNSGPAVHWARRLSVSSIKGPDLAAFASLIGRPSLGDMGPPHGGDPEGPGSWGQPLFRLMGDTREPDGVAGPARSDRNQGRRHSRQPGVTWSARWAAGTARGE